MRRGRLPDVSDLAPLLYGAAFAAVMMAVLLGPMRRWPPRQRRRGAIVLMTIGIALGVVLGALYG